MPVPFDPDQPPASPPPGCPHPLMYRLAYQLHRDHRPDADGFCVTCVPAEFLPCIGRHLAQRGLRFALGGSDAAPVGEWSR